MISAVRRNLFRLTLVLLLLVTPAACRAAVEVTKLDMTSIFNRDGIWSVAVGDQPNDGFDQAGECLPEDTGYPGEAGLPPDGKVGDFQLGDYDNLNMLSIVQGAGTTVFDLSATGQAGRFEKLRFLTATADGQTGAATDADKLMVRLVYADVSVRDFLLLSQDWHLSAPYQPQPPLTPAPVLIGFGESPLYVFEFDQVDPTKTLTQIVFMEGDPRSTIGDPSPNNRFNILAINGYSAMHFDMTSVFNWDGIWSVGVGYQPWNGFDSDWRCLIENGHSGWPGLPSDGKVQDFRLGNYDDLNIVGITQNWGDKTFDLAATGQAGKFGKLRFLVSSGDGGKGTETDKLAVKLIYEDGTTRKFLLLSQDWYLGSPPRTPPAPLTLGISGMARSDDGSNFALYVFEFDQVDCTKTLTKIVFMESDPQTTIGDTNWRNRFNILAITARAPVEPLFVTKFDMTGMFNRDGIWSIAVGDQAFDGFDQIGGPCLIENGYNGWPGLSSDGRVQDFQLGNYDGPNVLRIYDEVGDVTFDLSSAGIAKFQKLRFLTAAGNGYKGTSTDKLMVRLVYDDATTQDFLLLTQDWYLGSPPRTPPAPLTLGISGMARSDDGSDFALYVFEFGEVDVTKNLIRIIFREGDPQSTVGNLGWGNTFNILAVTGYARTRPGIAKKLDMANVFNNDGIWSVAVGDQLWDGFDFSGECLIENGYNTWPGLPSDGKVQDFQLGNYDNLNMLSVVNSLGDKSFDLSATGQAARFEKLRFLTSVGNGHNGANTDTLKVRLEYDDGSTQDFLLLSQDWYLGDPPRTPPAPLTLGIAGMARSSGGSNFALYVFEFDRVESAKTLTRIIFLVSDPQTNLWGTTSFNILAITGHVRTSPTIRKVGNSVFLTWHPFGSGRYSVQYTDDLDNPIWIIAYPGGFPIEPSWTDDDVRGLLQRFYRVMSESQ
ncbi:MAG: hypothetical protein Q8Q12_10250 [bacterium]|nr:hypothetical protein [bacterium]